MRRSPYTISFNDHSFGGTMFAFRKDNPTWKIIVQRTLWFVIAERNSFGLRLKSGSISPLQHPRRIPFSTRTSGLLSEAFKLSYRDRFKFSTITFSRLIGQLAKIYPSISGLCTFHRSCVFRLKLLHTLCRWDTKSLHKTTHVYGFY